MITPSKGIILSLFDESGVWSDPFAAAGFDVIRVDLKNSDDPWSGDVLEMQSTYFDGQHVVGVMAGPPCTDFAGSGARWWKDKDADGRTEASVRLVQHTMNLIYNLKPDWWVIENPVGRMARLVPELLDVQVSYHHPHEYAGWLEMYGEDPGVEAYTKKTGLWGTINHDLPKRDVEPVMYERGGKRGSWMWANLGGKSERTKTLRSRTPKGMALAFYMAQTI